MFCKFKPTCAETEVPIEKSIADLTQTCQQLVKRNEQLEAENKHLISNRYRYEFQTKIAESLSSANYSLQRLADRNLHLCEVLRSQNSDLRANYIAVEGSRKTLLEQIDKLKAEKRKKR